LACIDPDEPRRVVVVHDFSSDGAERAATYETFWNWFKAAVDDMIAFGRVRKFVSVRRVAS